MNINNIGITVIIAVFNGEQFIEDTIQSVLNQEVRIELIIVDGQSTDKTVEIINKYKDQLYGFISEKDNGIYDAFNKGWNMASADSFILYLGVGDKLLTLPSRESFSGVDVVFGKVILSEKVTFKSKLGFVLKLGNTLHHQALLVKKELYPISPFDTRFNLYADFDFNQRLYKNKARFRYDNDFLSYALPGGVSSDFDKAQSLEIVKKNFGKFYSSLARIYYALQRIKNSLKF